MLTKLTSTIHRHRFPIFIGVASRIGYSVWLIIIWLIVDRFIPLSPQALAETYNHLTRSTTFIGRAFIDVWLRWDAVHYMNIAQMGYPGVSAGDTVFFPLYPYLVGGLSKLLSVNVTLVGILVSSISALLAWVCLYDLIILLFHDEKLARLSIGLMALYPTAIFLQAPFTDALFLCLTTASILMMVQQKHIPAGVFACAAGLTRPQGILLLVPMVVLFIQSHWINKNRLDWREIFAMILAPAGFGFYSIWRMQHGLSGMFQSLQDYSSVRFQDPISTLVHSVVGIIQNPTVLQVTELLSVLLFLAILIWMFTQNEFRQNLAIMLYSAATWLLITSKTTIVGNPLQSANRYVIHIFFAFVGMAVILQKTSVKVRQFILTTFLILSLVCSALYPLWIFIG